MTDIIIGCGILLTALNGLRQGLVKQLVSLVGVFLAFFLARSFYDDLAPLFALIVPMPELIPDNPLLQQIPGLNLEEQLHGGMAFILVFIVIFLLIQMAGSLIDLIAKLPGLSLLNRVLGLVLGAILGVIFAAVLVNVLALLPYDQLQQALTGSQLAQELLAKFPFFKLYVPAV
ncbi:CvpA family protein [Tumebacillus lipolyticus]|uniref:CvpA family protein n=1 Tax=Tumebacillus lipolyticus TaxID=1280370 RepID=A0ABW4ZVC8_9BACL